jgi:hypothetical protein
MIPTKHPELCKERNRKPDPINPKLTRKEVAFKRKNLESQGLYFALFRAGYVLGALAPRATFTATVASRPWRLTCPGLHSFGLSGLALCADL